MFVRLSHNAGVSSNLYDDDDDFGGGDGLWGVDSKVGFSRKRPGPFMAIPDVSPLRNPKVQSTFRRPAFSRHRGCPGNDAEAFVQRLRHAATSSSESVAWTTTTTPQHHQNNRPAMIPLRRKFRTSCVVGSSRARV
mmetsp:Transcript_22597/g.72716  ORF Transcript_22597/g.72716 Transcript_22597/m.72716 type:complete len:136 (-) Transcript_22597:62-469(-)